MRGDDILCDVTSSSDYLSDATLQRYRDNNVPLKQRPFINAAITVSRFNNVRGSFNSLTRFASNISPAADINAASCRDSVERFPLLTPRSPSGAWR